MIRRGLQRGNELLGRLAPDERALVAELLHELGGLRRRRLCTAVGVPRRAMLRARLAPITASPVTPMRLLPVDSVTTHLALARAAMPVRLCPRSCVSCCATRAVLCEQLVRFRRPPGGGLVERDAAGLSSQWAMIGSMIRQHCSTSSERMNRVGHRSARRASAARRPPATPPGRWPRRRTPWTPTGPGSGGRAPSPRTAGDALVGLDVQDQRIRLQTAGLPGGDR